MKEAREICTNISFYEFETFTNNWSIEKNYEKQEFHKVIENIWKLISRANKYVDESAPWQLIKDDRERAGDVLNILVIIIAKIAIFLAPIMPDISENILNKIGFNQLNENEKYYPLTIYYCEDCFLVQVSNVISVDVLFREKYFLLMFSYDLFKIINTVCMICASLKSLILASSKNLIGISSLGVG